MEGAQVGALASPVANKSRLATGPLTDQVAKKSIAGSKSSQAELSASATITRQL